jgi:uncharacterized protein (TIGR03435 family)
MPRTIVTAALATCISYAAVGQPAAPIPAFEVASVKPNRSSQRGSIDTEPGKVTVRNVSLKLIIQAAYGVKGYQISGPGWLESQRYDIVAKAASPVWEDDKLMAMLQPLLLDRFKLTLHREARDLPAWMLVPGNKGSKLHASKDDGLLEIERKGPESLTARRMSMEQLANYLTTRMDHPVLDMTGIKGLFDIALDWTRDRGLRAPGSETAEVAGPSVFTALQEQLGLKMEARKGPVTILVVDHAEKVPTAN